MMKHQTTLATGLAALLVLPSMAISKDELQTLEEALAGTVRSLEVLAGLEARVVTAPREAAPLVIGATEAPFLPDEARDERLGSLRREVSLLQMELDAIETPAAAAPREGMGSSTGGALPSAVSHPIPVPTTGLNQSVRDLIKRSSLSPDERAQAMAPAKSVATAPVQAEAFDPADALSHAKANYHAGKYEDALVLLAGREDMSSLYWKSRCLTQLDRMDEAIATLTKIVAAAGDTYEGRRAATDLDFANWKKGFSDALPKGLKKNGAADQ